MKPENFDQLSKAEQKQMAVSLWECPRGQYLIAQALHVAIRTMKKAKEQELELSNIEDMEMLLHCVYSVYAGCFRQ